jgi:antitoxin component YwqK of YwqJK toxin-antitoxin module
MKKLFVFLLVFVFSCDDGSDVNLAGTNYEHRYEIGGGYTLHKKYKKYDNELINYGNPVLIDEGLFKNGEEEGLHKSYNNIFQPIGRLYLTRNYKDGKLHGEKKNYRDNGYLRELKKRSYKN